jgi:hypothetical protein
MSATMRWPVLLLLVSLWAGPISRMDAQSAEAVALPTREHVRWLERNVDAALETFMPMKDRRHSLVRYRMFHPLNYTLEEKYFSIAGEERDGPLTVNVVVPRGDSIQRQLMVGHMNAPTADLESLLKHVSLRRHSFESTGCPAIRWRLESLPDLRIEPLRTTRFSSTRLTSNSESISAW